MMDKQRQEAREMVKEMPFGAKLKYFWEYYKIHTIVTICVLIAVISTVYGVVTRERFDLQITYYGEAMFSDEQAKQFEEYLETMVEDLDGNGEVNVGFTVVSTMPADAKGQQDAQYAMAISQKFMAELTAGGYAAFIVDDKFYEQIRPDSDAGVMESAFDLRESEKAKEILGLTDKPIYWCTRKVYENEQSKENVVRENETAKKVEDILKNNK